MPLQYSFQRLAGGGGGRPLLPILPVYNVDGTPANAVADGVSASLFRHSVIAVAVAVAVAVGVSASVSGAVTLQQDWTNRSTAAGVTQAKRFTTSTDVTNWIHGDGNAGQAEYDTSDGIIGGGCLKINFPAELGTGSAQWRVPLNTAWVTDAQGFGSTPYYVMYACKFSPGSLVASNGGQGPKLSILGEYRPSSPNSSNSNTDNEIVIQNTFNRGVVQAYHNPAFEAFEDSTTLPGEIMFQNTVDHGSGGIYDRYCLYQAGNASAGCWDIPEGEWFWVKQRIEHPSVGGSAGNKFELWVAKATDTSWTKLMLYTNFTLGNDAVTPLGPNGLWLLPYDTGRTGANYDAWRKYDQIIVSTNDIALPAAIPVIPYALPAAGATVTVSGNTIQDIKPAEFNTTQINYSIYNSYGFGIPNPYYSRYGAMIIAGTGGHAHPDFTGQFAWDATTGTWILHEHNNGGTRYGGNLGDLGYSAGQTNGSPYYEITGSGQTPSPPHPYQNAALRPPKLGGGTRGRWMYVGHCALHADGINHSQSVHDFDPDTNLWARVTNNLGAGMSYETGVLYDEKRSRYWIFHQGAENNQFIRYLDATDWAFKTVSLGGFPDVAEIGNGGRPFMLRDIIFLQLSDGTMLSFDPDDPTSNVDLVTITGAPLPAYTNAFEYFPQTNKLYWAPVTGGTTLTRLTPPAGNLRTGTWVKDTVAISPGLAAQTTLGDPGGNANHYRALMYLPGINRLAWFPGGANPVQLVYPT